MGAIGNDQKRAGGSLRLRECTCGSDHVAVIVRRHAAHGFAGHAECDACDARTANYYTDKVITTSGALGQHVAREWNRGQVVSDAP